MGSDRSSLRRRAAIAGVAVLVVMVPSNGASATGPGSVPAGPATTRTTQTSSHPATRPGTRSDLDVISREGQVRTGTGSVTAVVALAVRPGTSAALDALAARASSLSGAARTHDLDALAPPRSARDAVVAWARSHHLTVERAGAWDVTVSAAPALMSSAFAATLVPVAAPSAPLGPKAYVRPVAAPAVPSALAGVASSVTGLDNRPLFQPRAAAQRSPVWQCWS